MAAPAAAHLSGHRRACVAFLCRLSMGRLKVNAPAVVEPGNAIDPTAFADPVPQALVLTAIVISFATTALFLVVLLA